MGKQDNRDSYPPDVWTEEGENAESTPACMQHQTMKAVEVDNPAASTGTMSCGGQLQHPAHVQTLILQVTSSWKVWVSSL